MESKGCVGCCSGCSDAPLYYRWKSRNLAFSFKCFVNLRNNFKGGVLQNKVTKFISGISMEIYLSHMVIYRAIERLGMNQMIGNGWFQYMITVILVLCGTTIFAIVMQKIIKTVGKKLDGIILKAKEASCN